MALIVAAAAREDEGDLGDATGGVDESIIGVGGNALG